MVRLPFGFTLIELMITISVLAILITLGVPSFQDTLERHRLKAAIEQVYQDLQYARSEAIKRNQNITVQLKIPAGTDPWCYGLSDAGGCDCTASPGCAIDGDPKNTTAHDFRNIALDGFHTADFNFAFDAHRGGGADRSIRLNSASGYETQVVVSALGRVRLCSDDDVMGYPSC
ncbi:GspH/FimT family pseudopilin [Thiohalomonas denitrificans]|uniref:Type II secretion system protein H n=1 Tax=Thiohalomonas denitrificans TaxID=415747 RepID=A0A1G5PQI7_9GAMM|nr:GspH/FimT family pseudopilin [Thiohalomonas denitrificans]SCZ51596.1 type IV fimbrial biogenesis protein FimT [Thiohalomonas denitrificans]